MGKGNGKPGVHTVGAKSTRIIAEEPTSLSDVLALIRECQKTPWRSQQGTYEWVSMLLVEVAELEEVYYGEEEEEPFQNVIDEAADVLASTMTLLLSIEKETEGELTIQKVLDSIVDKLRRRKPWIFDATMDPPSTPEEEMAIWHDAKDKEKKGE